MFIPALTYNGSAFDTMLNAAVLVILIVALAIQRRSPWWISLVVMVVVQVTLWSTLGATGVSVLWSGLTGVAVVEFVAGRESSGRTPTATRSSTATSPLSRRRWMLTATILVALATLVYFAVTLPPLSTVAHLLSLGIGAGVHTVARSAVRRRASRHERTTEAPLTEAGPFRLPERLHQQMLEKWPEYYGYNDELHYGIWGDAGLLITREKDGYRVDRRADRSNYYDQFRFRTSSFRQLQRRLLQE